MANKQTGSKSKNLKLEIDSKFALGRLRSRFLLLGIAWSIGFIYTLGSTAPPFTLILLLGLPVVLGGFFWVSAKKRIRLTPHFGYQLLRKQDGVLVQIDPVGDGKSVPPKEILVTAQNLKNVNFRREIAGVTVTFRGQGFLIRIPGVENYAELFHFLEIIFDAKKINYPIGEELPIPTWFWLSLLPAGITGAFIYLEIIYVFYGFLIVFSNIGLSLFRLRQNLVERGLSFAPLRLAALLVAVFTIVALINVYTIWSETGGLPPFLMR